MKPIKIGTIILFFFLLTGLWTCKDTITGGGLSSIVFPTTKVPYSKVQQLFNAGCGGQSNSCHGPDTFTPRPAGNGFSLDSYDHLMFGDFKVVFTRNPDASPLNITIEGKGTKIMPPLGQPQLNDNQKKGVRQWVLEGADGGS
jgi:hypothetical protein